MFKAFLEALQRKFPGVDAKWLEPMARQLAKTTTKEEDVQTAVDAVTTSQVMEAYSDFRVNSAVQTASAKAVTEYEAKYGLKDGEKVNGGTSGEQKQPQKTKAGEEEPEWAKKLNKRFDDYEKREAEKEERSKQQGYMSVLESILKEKGVRETFYRAMISGRTFKDEDEAKAYAETVEQSFKDDQQAAANGDHSTGHKPDTGNGNEGEDPLLKAAEEKNNELAAKHNKS